MSLAIERRPPAGLLGHARRWRRVRYAIERREPTLASLAELNDHLLQDIGPRREHHLLRHLMRF